MSTSQKPTIGFLGLGAMGFGMATHLVKQGYPVKGFDISPKSLERFKEAGGLVASSLADSAKDCPYYVCMVASAPQAQAALFDAEDAVVKSVQTALPQGATLLLCSTVPSAYAQSVQDQLTKLGRSDVFFIDCPVSGGATRAADGTLSIMAGASDAALEKGKFLLAEMSDEKKLYIVEGGIGAGSNMKMVHQVLAAIQILATSEAMGLAARLGLDARMVREKVIQSEAWSWMFENRTPRLLKEDYLPPVSALTIILKDAGIVTLTARLESFPTPLCSTAEQVYLSGLSQGYGADDDAGMVRMYFPDPVTKIAKKASDDSKVSLIITLLTAIHLCAAAEGIAFAHHLGLDLSQYYELCIDAAGGSVMFKEQGKEMIKALVLSVTGKQNVWDELEGGKLGDLTKSLVDVVQQARDLNCPLHLGSEALNMLLMAQRKFGSEAKAASAVRIWSS